LLSSPETTWFLPTVFLFGAPGLPIHTVTLWARSATSHPSLLPLPILRSGPFFLRMYFQRWHCITEQSASFSPPLPLCKLYIFSIYSDLTHLPLRTYPLAHFPLPAHHYPIIFARCHTQHQVRSHLPPLSTFPPPSLPFSRPRGVPTLGSIHTSQQSSPPKQLLPVLAPFYSSQPVLDKTVFDLYLFCCCIPTPPSPPLPFALIPSLLFFPPSLLPPLFLSIFSSALSSQPFLPFSSPSPSFSHPTLRLSFLFLTFHSPAYEGPSTFARCRPPPSVRPLLPALAAFPIIAFPILCPLVGFPPCPQPPRHFSSYFGRTSPPVLPSPHSPLSHQSPTVSSPRFRVDSPSPSSPILYRMTTPPITVRPYCPARSSHWTLPPPDIAPLPSPVSNCRPCPLTNSPSLLLYPPSELRPYPPLPSHLPLFLVRYPTPRCTGLIHGGTYLPPPPSGLSSCSCTFVRYSPRLYTIPPFFCQSRS